MCGIIGIHRTPGEPAAFALAAGQEALRRRGPDDQGVFRHALTELGHCRLSILDLSNAGHQPMSEPTGRYTIVYNGETYNFRELRQELAGRGHCFTSLSDTEVVLAAFATWGTDAFRRLNGIFAAAIHDSEDGSLTLVRDRLGVKPLYWHRTAHGSYCFASEVNALLRLAEPSRQVDGQALHEFLFFGVPHGDRTLFRAINRLEPGHWMRIAQGTAEIRPYWNMADLTSCHDNAATARERIVGLLRQAVRRQTVSDVPIACFLSGGVDSTAVTTFAVESGAKPDAYTATFDHQLGNDELSIAQATARRLGIPHHELRIAIPDVRTVVEELVAIHGEPFSDAANIPLLMLCRALQGRAKVVLQGDGGDELFAGYRHHWVLAHQAAWKMFARAQPLMRPLFEKFDRYRRLDRIFSAMTTQDEGTRFGLLLTTDRTDEPPSQLLSVHCRELVHGHDPFLRYKQSVRASAGCDLLQRMLRTEMQTILPDVFLEKVDRSTMACGIESRVPFLDNDLVDYALSLPGRVIMPGGKPKGLLRSALLSHLPPAVIRAPKSGFGVPFGHWLRDGQFSRYAETRIREAQLSSNRLFDGDAIGDAFRHHRTGSRDRGFILWKCLNLAIWVDRYHVTY